MMAWRRCNVRERARFASLFDPKSPELRGLLFVPRSRRRKGEGEFFDRSNGAANFKATCRKDQTVAIVLTIVAPAASE
jgi:hypothetical protein